MRSSPEKALPSQFFCGKRTILVNHETHNPAGLLDLPDLFWVQCQELMNMVPQARGNALQQTRMKAIGICNSGYVGQYLNCNRYVLLIRLHNFVMLYCIHSDVIAPEVLDLHSCAH